MATLPDVPETTSPAEPQRGYRGYVRPDPRILQAALPPLTYIVTRQLTDDLWVAIAASFAASAFVFVRNPGRGALRALGVIGFCVVAGSAVLGLVLGSGEAFVAQNLFSDFVFAGIFLGSVLLGRPLIGAIARDAAPALVPVMQVRHPLFVRLTLMAAAVNLATGLVRIPMLIWLTETQYVIASRAVGLPVGIAFYFLCYVLVHRTAFRIWPDDLPPPNRDGTPGAVAAP